MDLDNNFNPKNKNENVKSNKKLLILKLFALILVLLAIYGLVLGWRYYQDRDNRALTKQLLSEESDEDEKPAPVSEADKYVADFKYTADVKIGDQGFTPSTISVKPQTKIIFTTTDAGKYFVAVSPGSKAPKLFDPKVDITKNSQFQTKVEEVGTYSFYDTYNPKFTLVVTVTDK